MDANHIIDEEIDEVIVLKEAFTEELLKQIDIWNGKLRELNIPLKIDLNFVEENI